MHSPRRNLRLVAGLTVMLLSAVCRGDDREPGRLIVRLPNEVEFTAPTPRFWTP